MRKFIDDVFYTLDVWGGTGTNYGSSEGTALAMLMVTIFLNIFAVTFFIIGVNDLNKSPYFEATSERYFIPAFVILVIMYIAAYRYFISSKRYEKIRDEREGKGYMKVPLIYLSASVFAIVIMFVALIE
ncbi:MAG: hypothetical protein AAF433_16875 [Bacteroidota bacterium]